MTIPLPLHRVAILLSVVGTLAAAAEDGPAWIGYRGPEGSGVYADAKPPADVAGKIRWTADLPNWGLSSPVAVGDKVFVTCEGGWPEGQDFPQLLCFEAGKGKELWRRTLDHLPHTIRDAGKRKRITEAWSGILARFRLAYSLHHRWYTGDEAAKKEANAAFAANGFGWKGSSNLSYGALRGMTGTYDGDKLKIVQEAGLDLCSWQHQCGMGMNSIGQSYATPVTDGVYVWVPTSFGSFFCFDLAGELRWVALDVGDLRGDYCRNARSPLIHGNLLLSDIGMHVRAFDKATGRLLWKHAYANGHPSPATPVVITCGGKDLLLYAGPSNSTVTAFSLPDGKPMKVEGWGNPAGSLLVKHDERDVVFFAGAGDHCAWDKKGPPPPAAVRFALDGDALKATVVWSGIDGKPHRNAWGNNQLATVYLDGRLYFWGQRGSGWILDAATGKALAGNGGRAVPQTRHLLAIANGHVYGLDAGKVNEANPGTLEVYNLKGSQVSRLVLPVPEPDELKRRQIAEQTGLPRWGFSYGCPFTIGGNSIFVRSNDQLFCIGE